MDNDRKAWQGFVNTPQRVLFVLAAFLATCGGVDMIHNQFDLDHGVMGLRVSAVLMCCGLLAGRIGRHRALAMTAIDAALVVLLVMAVNYTRLALKWYTPNGSATLTLLGATMGIGCMVGFLTLLTFRPRRDARGHDWWTVSPLLSLPAMVLWPGRARHGLTLSRRFGMAIGVGLLVVGFMATNTTRLPRDTVAGVMQSVRFVTDTRGLIDAALSDRQRLQELLNDSRAQQLIDRIAPAGSQEAELVDAELAHFGLTMPDLDPVFERPRTIVVERDEIDRAIEALRTGRFEIPDGLLDQYAVDAVTLQQLSDHSLVSTFESAQWKRGNVATTGRFAVTGPISPRINNRILLERISNVLPPLHADEARAPFARYAASTSLNTPEPSNAFKIDWDAPGWWSDADANLFDVTSLGWQVSFAQQEPQALPHPDHGALVSSFETVGPVVANNTQALTTHLLWVTYVAGITAMAIGLYLVAAALAGAPRRMAPAVNVPLPRPQARRG